MPDPHTIAYGYAYIDDDKTLMELVAALMLERTWFDVRVPRDHRWQICFNPAMKLPAKLVKRLIEVPDHPTDVKVTLAKYKAQRKAMNKRPKR
jgi:hypothetical protein